MIRVTIELFPYGLEEGRKILATAAIWNDGTGDNHVGNYGFKLYDQGGRVWKKGKVVGFPRQRRLSWDLLHRVLNIGIGSERT